MLNDFVFFTLNDFSKDDGGTVRMYGILNSIATLNKNVILISNASEYTNFNKNIKHVNLEKKVSKLEKKYYQFLLGILPFFLVRILTFFIIDKIKEKILYHNLVSRDIVFFEYMDNSVAYTLKRLHIVDNYINDIHGVASIEFGYKTDSDLIPKIFNRVKYYVSKLLDKKVFEQAKGFIFVSDTMKLFFENKYPFILNKESIVIRDGISKLMCEQTIENGLLRDLKSEFNIKSATKVIFFAGDFKDLGGVVDLVDAFSILNSKKQFSDLKLILIGDGERYSYIKNLVVSNNLNNIILVGRVPYSQLRTYQELASIIVCPDKKHPYSNMVPHIKYFDSLASGKIVINGSFDSTKEMNTNEVFSINFEPSNILDLANKLQLCLENYDSYLDRFKNNNKIICNRFTYKNFIKNAIH